jgi:hypothetical protein
MKRDETKANGHMVTIGDSEKISRDELLEMTSRLFRILHRRTTAPRFKTSQHDRPRLAYARAAVTAATAYAGILKDVELDELKRRIEALELAKGQEKVK